MTTIGMSDDTATEIGTAKVLSSSAAPRKGHSGEAEFVKRVTRG
jgi:hypothetical protein